jgi:uncharacterized protein YjaZ
VLFIDAPDEVIPEWGIGGSTSGPHVIIVALDPEFPGIPEQHLVSTLVHEFHHAMRWRGHGCGTDLGYRICRDYSDSTAKRAPELVNVPAPAVLRAAGPG